MDERQFDDFNDWTQTAQAILAYCQGNNYYFIGFVGQATQGHAVGLKGRERGFDPNEGFYTFDGDKDIEDLIYTWIMNYIEYPSEVLVLRVAQPMLQIDPTILERGNKRRL